MMTFDQAIALLDEVKDAPGLCRVNASRTRSQAVQMIRVGLIVENQRRHDYGKGFFVTTDGTLSRVAEMRVWQVVRNQRRPRF